VVCGVDAVQNSNAQPNTNARSIVFSVIAHTHFRCKSICQAGKHATAISIKLPRILQVVHEKISSPAGPLADIRRFHMEPGKRPIISRSRCDLIRHLLIQACCLIFNA